MIVVSDANVTLDGIAIDNAQEGEGFHSLDNLLSRLKERRETSLGERPGAPPTMDQWLDVQPGASTVRALSALMTAAFAGYTKVHIKTKRGWFDGQYDVPMPPVPGADTIHTRAAVHLDAHGLSLSWQSDGTCERVPPDTLLQSSDLDKYLDNTCKNMAAPCVDFALIALGAEATFSDAVDALEAFRRHAGTRFSFRLYPAGPKHTKRVCGRPIVTNDGLTDDQIRATVVAASAQLRTCYEQRAARNPTLRGTVTLKWEIAGDGHVEHAALVESPSDLALSAAPALPDPPFTTLHDPLVTSCILEVCRGLTFPRSPGGAPTIVASFPFRFGVK